MENSLRYGEHSKTAVGFNQFVLRQCIVVDTRNIIKMQSIRPTNFFCSTRDTSGDIVYRRCFRYADRFTDARKILKMDLNFPRGSLEARLFFFFFNLEIFYNLVILLIPDSDKNQGNEKKKNQMYVTILYLYLMKNNLLYTSKEHISQTSLNRTRSNNYLIYI